MMAEYDIQFQCSCMLCSHSVWRESTIIALMHTYRAVPNIMCIFCSCQPHTHTHPFNGSFSGTTQVSQYQKGKTNLDFTEARDSEWQWHQLDHMQVCTSLQTDNHTSTPPLKFFTGRMPFLPPNQQRQSTESRSASRLNNVFVFQWIILPKHDWVQ